MQMITPFIPPIKFILIVLLSVLISCSQTESQQETTVLEPDRSTSQNEEIDIELPALFTGTLPCADCPGINYRLILEEKAFTEISNYQDRSQESFMETGTWETDGDTLTLIGEENLVLKRFLVDESKLTLLNRNNQQITGDLAEMYILGRVGNQESIREHHQELANRGYSFYATGNEPFWSLSIDSSSQVTFETPEAKINFGKADISTIRNEMQFDVATDSTQLSIQIVDEYCQDSMSGYLFPQTIKATLQPSQVDSLHGCGLFFDLEP